MNGIDISSHQTGIDLSKVPCDFVIIKATQGTSYVNPDFKRAINQAISLGKCVGVYHYIDGQGASAEMEHFINTVKPYLKNAIPCLDWEKVQNAKWRDESYLEECIKAFKAKTGIPPMIYSSKAFYPTAVSERQNCGIWMAQYPNSNIQNGYVENPWNEGAYSCAIRQYSGTGRLPGYSGNLDLNKAYIDRDAWAKYANPTVDTKPAQPESKPVNDAGLYYQAHVQKLGWLSQVHDGMIAGTTGQSLRLEALKINPPEGLELEVKLHIQKEGWRTFTGIKHGNDVIIGTTGKAERIEAFEIDVVKNDTGKALKYCAHRQGAGWTGWTDAGYSTGSDGLSKRIEAVEIKLV